MRNTQGFPPDPFYARQKSSFMVNTGSGIPWPLRLPYNNEDVAQELERHLVDSYLRLGEISHLAVQRDTITKHY